jgi:two-component SAPR family response regulator
MSAMLKFEMGDFEDAISRFEELNRYDLNNNVKSFAFWYYLLICEAYMFLNLSSKAKEFLQLAESAKDSNDEYQAVEYDLHCAIVNKHEKTDPKIEKTLISAHKYFDSLNLIYSKTQVEFHLADYFYKKSNPQTALKYLLDSLNTSTEKQYSSFLSQNFNQLRYLFDFAAANNIRKDFTESIHSSLLERVNVDWLSAECLTRLKKEQEALYDITLLTFGGAELFVRGKRISEDKWLRKKSKLLLIYLLINQNLKISKEKVLGLFFGELAADSAENIFHQAITNIRSALKPDAISGDDTSADTKKSKKTKSEKETSTEKQKTNKNLEFSPPYLVYEDKILRMAQGYYFKVDAIELGKIHSLIKSPETDNAKKQRLANQALEIYKGEFLPGYYEPWIEEMRLVLENKFTDICEHIIKAMLNDNNHDEVVKFAEKLLETDKLHEEAYINAIHAYSMLGNHTMAKKKFSQMLKNYQDEFGEKPSDGALKRIESILLEN